MHKYTTKNFETMTRRKLKKKKLNAFYTLLSISVDIFWLWKNTSKGLSFPLKGADTLNRTYNHVLRTTTTIQNKINLTDRYFLLIPCFSGFGSLSVPIGAFGFATSSLSPLWVDSEFLASSLSSSSSSSSLSSSSDDDSKVFCFDESVSGGRGSFLCPLSCSRSPLSITLILININ